MINHALVPGFTILLACVAASTLYAPTGGDAPSPLYAGWARALEYPKCNLAELADLADSNPEVVDEEVRFWVPLCLRAERAVEFRTFEDHLRPRQPEATSVAKHGYFVLRVRYYPSFEPAEVVEVRQDSTDQPALITSSRYAVSAVCGVPQGSHPYSWDQLPTGIDVVLSSSTIFDPQDNEEAEVCIYKRVLSSYSSRQLSRSELSSIEALTIVVGLSSIDPADGRFGNDGFTLNLQMGGRLGSNQVVYWSPARGELQLLQILAAYVLEMGNGGTNFAPRL